MIVANVKNIQSTNIGNRNFKKTMTITPNPGSSKVGKMVRERSIGSILRETLDRQPDSDDEETIKSVAKSKKKMTTASIKRVLPNEDLLKQRIPDTEHLTRMRALLVAAHSNDAFIKKLSNGNSYVP